MKENNNLLILIIVLLVVVFSGGTSMMGFGIGNMMSAMMGSYGAGMMLFIWIFSILIFITLILFIIWLIKQIQK